MNRIYILGEVLSVSQMHFDYYNKLKIYFKFNILDMYDNVFECVVLEKKVDVLRIFEMVNMKKGKDKFIFVICSLENGKYIVRDIY